mgnify:CR=1 FL=1
MMFALLEEFQGGSLGTTGSPRAFCACRGEEGRRKGSAFGFKCTKRTLLVGMCAPTEREGGKVPPLAHVLVCVPTLARNTGMRSPLDA